MGQATFRDARQQSRGDSEYAGGWLHERFCEGEAEAEVYLGIYCVGMAGKVLICGRTTWPSGEDAEGMECEGATRRSRRSRQGDRWIEMWLCSRVYA